MIRVALCVYSEKNSINSKKEKKKKKRGSFFFDRDVGLQHPNVSEVELYEDNFSWKS